MNAQATIDRAAARRLDRIVRMKIVVERTGLHRATIYRMIAAGTFPPQVRLGANSSGWYEGDINDWIADPVGWKAAA